MSNKKKEFFLVRWFKRCFLHERPELSTEEEEKIQTPMRAMVNNFTHRPLAMFGLIVFLAIFVFVMVGPHIWVLDLSEQDSTLTNLPPSNNMMQVPKALLDNGVKDISSGNTYGVGIDNKGELYTWGHTRITDKIDVANIPDEIKSADLVQIAAGTDHVVAVDTDGEVYVWGNAVKGEANVPALESKIVHLYGGRYHYTALLENGDLVSWGNNKYGQIDVPAKAQSADNIEKIFVSSYQNYALASDGTMYTWGLKGFVLGTDSLGRDMLTRIVNGGQVTMTVGAISVVIATILGIIFGGVAGYFGGRIDILIMRIAEIVGGLPFIPFAMILSAVIGTKLDPTQRMYLIMVVLGVLSWVPTCRLVRAQILAQREMEYVTAAKAMGIREHTIVFRHILPNVVSLLIVSMTLDFATCMLTESTLSYLGFGIPLPTPTWGNLLNGANNSIVIQQYWWQWVFPAVIFGICTICINLIGDGLRDAMDPKSNSR